MNSSLNCIHWKNLHGCRYAIERQCLVPDTWDDFGSMKHGTDSLHEHVNLSFFQKLGHRHVDVVYRI